MALTKVNEIFKTGGKIYHTPYGRKVETCTVRSARAVGRAREVEQHRMSMLGERIGNDTLHAALSSFQFGHMTGIELPGETRGC
jgi:cell division protein FtsI/penicillin-binding protein 2